MNSSVAEMSRNKETPQERLAHNNTTDKVLFLLHLSQQLRQKRRFVLNIYGYKVLFDRGRG